MTDTAFKSWDDWHYEEVAKAAASAAAGAAASAAASAAISAKVETLRDVVRNCALDRLGVISPALAQRINMCSDDQKLQRAMMDLIHGVSPERISL